MHMFIGSGEHPTTELQPCKCFYFHSCMFLKAYFHLTPGLLRNIQQEGFKGHLPVLSGSQVSREVLVGSHLPSSFSRIATGVQ